MKLYTQPLVDEVIHESKKGKGRRHVNGKMLLKSKVRTMRAFSMGMMILLMMFCQCPISKGRKETKFSCLATVKFTICLTTMMKWKMMKKKMIFSVDQYFVAFQCFNDFVDVLFTYFCLLLIKFNHRLNSSWYWFLVE